MTLAMLRVLGYPLPEAMELIESRRPVVDFAAVYVRSVENFIRALRGQSARNEEIKSHTASIERNAPSSRRP